MNIKTAYCYDDVLLVPKPSGISSRSDVDLSVDLGKGIVLDIPVVSANMKNVTETAMVSRLSELGGLAILHRFFENDEALLLVFLNSVVKACVPQERLGASIGVQEKDKHLAAKLVEAGCKIICIDVAHGDSKLAFAMTEYIAKTYPEVLLIAGNVATGAAANRLALHGANVVKVGIGPGSICSTRIETGNGVPQLTALEDVYKASLRSPGDRKFKIIADGGISKAGDIVKALCFSDAVMLGSMLAGTDEAPGNAFIGADGKRYKQYEGSSTHKNKHVEGVRALVPAKGPVDAIIDHLMAGLRSGCSYQGCDNLVDLKKDPQFVAISFAGLKESHPHSVVIKD